MQISVLLFDFICSPHISESFLEITDNLQRSLEALIIRLNTTKQIKSLLKQNVGGIYVEDKSPVLKEE